MGTVKLCRFKGNEVETYREHNGWRDTWHHAVNIPSATGKDRSQLFLYDRINGEAKILAVHQDGSFAELKHYKGSSSRNPFSGSSWDIIVSGQFCGGSGSDMFLYDRQAGVAAIASLKDDGTFELVKRHTGWRKSWDIAVPGRWTGSKWHDILLYDRTNGKGKVLVSNGKGGLTTQWQYAGWWRDWDLIVPGGFGGGAGSSVLLFYRRITGDVVFYQLLSNGQWNELSREIWDPDWDVLAPGRFTADRTQLFCYSRRNPRAALFETTSSAKLSKVKDFGSWRTTWWAVTPGSWQSDSSTRDELFLYDNRLSVRIRAIRVADSDGTRQCPISKSDVKKWVDYANKVYASAGVQFTFELEDLRDTTINQVAKDAKDEPNQDVARKAATQFAAGVKGRLVVFFTYGPWQNPHGGGFSAFSADFVSMPRFSTTKMYYRDGTTKHTDNLSFFAHELGHYMGIPHPFAAPNYKTVPASKPEQAIINALKANGTTSFDLFDNDANVKFVFDTAPDVGTGYYEGKGLNPAEPSADVVVVSPADGIDLRFSPDRHNVMSYFSCDEFARISPDQARRVRQHLHSAGRRHLLG